GQGDQRTRCDKITVAHSITPLAATSNWSGTVSPSALAVLAFTIISNLTDLNWKLRGLGAAEDAIHIGRPTATDAHATQVGPLQWGRINPKRVAAQHLYRLLQHFI